MTSSLRDPLLELERAAQSAEKRLARASDARSQAELCLLDSGGLPERPQVIVGGQWCSTPEQVVRRLARSADPSVRALLVAYLDRQNKEYAALREALGLAALDQAESEAHLACTRVRRQIATTPSRSLAGILVKLRGVRSQLGDNADAAELVDSVLADVERLINPGT